MLPVLLGNTGKIFKSTLLNIKLAGADAGRISKLAPCRASLRAAELQKQHLSSQLSRIVDNLRPLWGLISS